MRDRKPYIKQQNKTAHIYLLCMHPIFYFLESTINEQNVPPLKNYTLIDYTSTIDPTVNVGLDPATNHSYCTASHCHSLCLTLTHSKILVL